MKSEVDPTNTPFQHTLIRASAGTGKTFQVSNRFIGLLLSGVEPHQILASTFTRKAAGEIVHRVLLRLADASLGGQSCEQLSKYLGRLVSRQEAAELLMKLRSQLHRLNVGTLDSVFIRIARGFALELGLPLEWAILDASHDADLRAESIRRLMAVEKSQRIVDLLRLLNSGHFNRSVHDSILETVSEVNSLYQLLPCREAWDWIDPPKPLSDPAVAKAIDELERPVLPGDNRIQNAVGQSIESARAGDWKSFLAKGIPLKIIKGENIFNRWTMTAEVREAFQPLVTHATSVLLTWLSDRTQATWHLTHAFDKRYRQLKAQAGVMTFEDITLGLMHGNLAGRLDDIYYRLDGRINHLLLDEFQDTSIPQWRVLEPIADEILQDNSGQKSFFCVGDVKQAIYGWRGGEAAIFSQLQERYSNLRADDLDVSRRCRPAILQAVNGVMGNLKANPVFDRDNEGDQAYQNAVSLWTDDFRTHIPFHKEHQGYVQLVTARTASDGQSQPHATLGSAAILVKWLVERSPGLSVGVLVRTNIAVARMVFELRKLRQAGQVAFETSGEGGNPLTDNMAVSVVLSLLRLADHPGDTAAVFHVQWSPLGTWVGMVDRQPVTVLRVASAVRRSLIEFGYGKTLETWVLAMTRAGYCDGRDTARLSQLIEAAYRYDPQADLRTGPFIRRVESERVPDPASAAVQVMTAHQAKGLEFDIVVMPELDRELNRFSRDPVVTDFNSKQGQAAARVACQPSAEARAVCPALNDMYQRAIQAKFYEDLCVLYVMMTRAKYALYMVIAPSKIKEKRPPLSYAGMLRHELAGQAPVVERKKLYEAGDSKWYEQISSRHVAPSPSVFRKPRLAIHPVGRFMPRMTPSGLSKPMSDLSSVLKLRTPRAAQYGQRIHEMLSRIEWLTDESIHDPDLTRVLSSHEIRSALMRNSYPVHADLEVYREEPFAYLDAEALRIGTFDRLVITRENGRVTQAHVLDFKSDQIPAMNPEAISAKTEHYRPQMEAYRHAAMRLYGLASHQIKLSLLLLSAGKVVEL